MIKVIVDVENVAALKDRVGDIFQDDPHPDVTLTYVVTKQPTSRRKTTT